MKEDWEGVKGFVLFGSMCFEKIIIFLLCNINNE